MKKKQNISFRLVSYTDAAGKYSPGAFRSGNEDNFYVDDDLTDDTTNSAAQDEVIQLGQLGMLMVVADGMGGMNAGEVASQIAIDTVRNAFKADVLTESVVATPQSRQKYLEQVIKQADKEIKNDARKDRSREGMGSTIIMAWLFNDELTISWCGDSRAYIFNDKSGIRLISQDHSYVQELVNNGMLTYDQTFDHPQNNIITRSLGDPTKEARPESKTLNVGKGDIILLCSDGLSGVLRDRKTYDSNGHLYPEENIEDIVRAHTSSMKDCREALWTAAERGAWYDNVTAILCQITDGPESRWASTPSLSHASNDDSNKKKTGLYLVLGIIAVAAIIVAFFIGKGSSEQIDEAAPIETPVSEDNDSTDAADSSAATSEEIQIEESDNKPQTKSTVEEKIKQQNNEDSDSTTLHMGLTKIKREEHETTELKDNNKLTPIKNIKKKEQVENPLAPTNPNKDNSTENTLTPTKSKKDNIIENPINNQ